MMDGREELRGRIRALTERKDEIEAEMESITSRLTA